MKWHPDDSAGTSEWEIIKRHRTSGLNPLLVKRDSISEPVVLLFRLFFPVVWIINLHPKIANSFTPLPTKHFLVAIWVILPADSFYNVSFCKIIYICNIMKTPLLFMCIKYQNKSKLLCRKMFPISIKMIHFTAADQWPFSAVSQFCSF